MALETKERYWDARRENLTRLRDHIGSGERSKRPRQRAPQGGPALRRVPNGSPHGTYKRTPPPRLDRIETPERDNLPNNSSDLRGSRYGKVPPLKPRRGFESTEDEDSWGEEADSEEDSEYERGPGYPHPLPHPNYPFPVVYPTVVYAPPPPPHLSYEGRHSRPRRTRAKSLERSRKKVRYVEEPTYIEYRNTPRAGQNSFYREGDSPQSLQYIHPQFSSFDPALNPVLKRYQYPDTDVSSPRDRRAKLVHEAAEHLRDRPGFGQKFTDQLVEEFLDEEIVPDLLIEVLSEQSENGPKDHPYAGAAIDTAGEILDHDVVMILRDLVAEVIGEFTDSYLGKQLSKRDPVSDIISDIVYDVVGMETADVVQEVVQDLVADHLEKAAAYDIIMDLVSEEVNSTGPSMVEDALLELLLEKFIEDEVVQPEVREGCHDVAVDLLTHYDNKVRKHQLKELNKFGGHMVADKFCLDYCLSLLARQGRVLTEDLGAERVLDGQIVGILLAELFGVKQSRDTTIDNKPVKRLHEKMVTDVALDVMLEELCLSLDEDMADLDEYEQGNAVPDGVTGAESDGPEWLSDR